MAAGGRAPGQQPHPPPRHAPPQLRGDHLRAREAAPRPPGLGDEPREGGLHRGGGLVHVAAVQTQPGLQPGQVVTVTGGDHQLRPHLSESRAPRPASAGSPSDPRMQLTMCCALRCVMIMIYGYLVSTVHTIHLFSGTEISTPSSPV